MIETENLSIYQSSLQRLIHWVEENHYTGWDAYDGLNSPLINGIKNPYLRVGFVQISRLSPINFRPLLKIEKGIDLKGMALFSQAYASLYRSTDNEHYKNRVENVLHFIKTRSLKDKYGYHCWSSHYYPYTASDKSTLSIDVPDIIGTSQVIVALMDSYAIFGRPEEREMALDAANYLVNEMFNDDDQFPFFGYSKNHGGDDRITLNASALAVEALARVMDQNTNFDFRTCCEKAIETLLKTQKEDGSWDYSIDRDGSTKRVQLDFHQGFIIDGLLAYLPFSHEVDSLNDSIRRGAEYYQKTLFRPKGSSYYRYPSSYPIDIHNQAQGIITFSKMQSIDEGYFPFAERIAKWTISNFQDNRGYFYYQKWPCLLNRIPFMRWSQAWMMLAIALLLESDNNSI